MKLWHVLLVGGLLPAGLVLFVGSYCVERLMGSVAEDDAALYAESVSCELNAELYDRLNIWKLFVRMPFVQNELAKTGSLTPVNSTSAEESAAIDVALAGDFSRELSAHANAVTEMTDHRVFGEVFITDRNGALVAANNRPSDYWQNDEEWWQEAVKQGHYISDKGYDDSAAMESIAICLRIDDEDGHLAGVLKAVVDIDDIDSIVKGLPNASGRQHSRKTWLLTCNASVLGAANVGAQPYKKPFERFKAVVKAEPSKVRAIPWRAVDGSDRMISFARPATFGKMSNPNWLVVVESDPQEGATTSLNTYRVAQLVGLLLALGGCVAMYFTSRQM